jgi:hypothetical protein
MIVLLLGAVVLLVQVVVYALVIAAVQRGCRLAGKMYRSGVVLLSELEDFQ